MTHLSCCSLASAAWGQSRLDGFLYSRCYVLPHASYAFGCIGGTQPGLACRPLSAFAFYVTALLAREELSCCHLAIGVFSILAKKEKKKIFLARAIHSRGSPGENEWIEVEVMDNGKNVFGTAQKTIRKQPVDDFYAPRCTEAYWSNLSTSLSRLWRTFGQADTVRSSLEEK